MVIHDDADMATVVRETVAALKECARHIGKADREITKAQANEIRTAIDELQNALRFKGASEA